jgi:ketosteroid isomerase-like protein/quercetin dioxygenase-like cupin family protein
MQPDVQENRFRILKDAYESFNRGDMTAAVVAMDPSVEWIEPAEFPGGDRPYRGPKDVMVYLANSRAGWEEGRSNPELLIPAGDRVVVFVHARFRRRGSVEWHDVRLADVYTFRGLVIVAMHAFASRNDALKFAGVTAKFVLTFQRWQEARPAGFTAILPDEIKWQPEPGLPGVQVATLLGDPDKQVPIVTRVKLPPNTNVMPHTHPNARTYTVLAGEWKLGFGEKFEPENLRTFPAGSVYRLPAEVPHFQATGEEGALIQIESIGPTRTDYLKPPDDPRKE